ncbi:hypothetical protein EVAR_97995_1 [Eumeta japonica]|uniref:G-protein coupled receptors family 1 profile domain-containing protein n=1 Tax=Eumeta variegata TaxID=151549 RepID=A0A4C1WIX1_EUMVA|nr:hypothetical protein EVAR_97995_1 [Eumeta japonica]
MKEFILFAWVKPQIKGVAVAASVFTLTAMSVDRWVSVAPEPLRPPGRRQALALLALLWATALLIFLPLLTVAVVQVEKVPIITAHALNISITSSLGTRAYVKPSADASPHMYPIWEWREELLFAIGKALQTVS